MEQEAENKKVNWTSVITFHVLACLISWPFFWWRDMEPQSWASWNVSGYIKTSTYMWGPGIAAIICFFIFRKSHHRTITFFGTSAIKSLLFWFVPAIVFAVISLQGFEILALPILGFLIILGEELGWRGFLQDAVRSISPFKRYLLIGAMWEIWHFTNRMSTGLHISTFVRVGIFIIALAIISFILGKLTDKTKSLCIAVTLHAWINLLAQYPANATYIIFGASVLFWSYLIWTWEKPLALTFSKTGGLNKI